MYLIQSLSSTYNLQYHQQLGAICAHVSRHYKICTLQKPERDLFVAHKLVNKFRAVFVGRQEGAGDSSCFSCFEDLVRYGVRCVLANLREGLLE